MPVLYGVPASPFVRKVMLAHAIKGVDYQLKMTPPGSDDSDFRAASPFGKIPGYQTDSGVGFADSSVIIAYLERLSDSNSLYPQDNDQYAMALWYEEFADTKMMEATAALYFQRIIGPRFFQQNTDQVRVEEITSKLIPPVLDFVESIVPVNGWLLGEQLTVADIAFSTNLTNLYHADFSIENWPKTAAYFARWIQQDALKTQLKQEEQMLNN